MDRAQHPLFQLFRILPCRLFPDVGPRDGASAPRAREVMPDARFAPFEAGRASCERIVAVTLEPYVSDAA